jgi:nucleoside 2-deoxyribosyltransferase
VIPVVKTAEPLCIKMGVGLDWLKRLYKRIMMNVYCSGPLFCPEEIAGMNAIARVLEDAGYGTFLPHRDGIERYVMGFVNTPLNNNILGMQDRINRAIFALDVYQIVERCDYLVFNMNGRVPDEGAVAEAGIAFATGKPVVLYKNDYRSPFCGKDNSMLLGLSVLDPVGDRQKLPSALMEAQQILERQGSLGRSALPASLSGVVGKGRKIWHLLDSYPVKAFKDKDILPLFKEIVTIED